MKVEQMLVVGNTVLVFTQNPEEDVKELQKAYDERDEKEYKFPLGYATPQLSTFLFLGNGYPCIVLWFDNDDIPDYFTKNEYI